MNLSRRQWLLGGAGLAVAGGLALRPAVDRRGHGGYFAALNRAVQQAGLLEPHLWLDAQALEHNIQTVRQRLAVRQLPCRIVVKSLPAPGLVARLMQALPTRRLMLFNLPMLAQSLQLWPDADVLMGKPLATASLARWLQEDAQGLDTQRVRWLVDTPARLQALAALAAARQQRFRVVLELDVGLHRGGLADTVALQAVLAQLNNLPQLQLDGLMAYDPHVAKVPSFLQAGAWQASQQKLAEALAVLRQAGHDPAQMIINGGGSPTYQRHAAGSLANEVAIGSAFVQPADFDAVVSGHRPACFITTPVLKVVQPALIPVLEWAAPLRRLWNEGLDTGYFVHGGHWLAQMASPPGLQKSGLYGESSNQELWLGSAATGLQVNDLVVLRPTQSEAVFLQFGDLRLYQPGQGVLPTRWPVFAVSA